MLMDSPVRLDGSDHSTIIGDGQKPSAVPAAIDGALTIKNTNKMAIKDIQSIRVTTYPAALN